RSPASRRSSVDMVYAPFIYGIDIQRCVHDAFGQPRRDNPTGCSKRRPARPQGSATRGITSVTFAAAGEMVSRPGLAWRPERTGDPLLFLMQRVDGTSRGSTGTHCLASCNG